VTLYTGLAPTGSPYIGNVVYKKGENPFVAVQVWGWCLIGVGGLLVLIFAFLIVYFKCYKKNSEERRESISADHMIVYSKDDSET